METTRIENWLYGLLTGDTQLAAAIGSRVYSYAAPQGATLPYVIFGYQGGHDVRGVGAGRIMASTLYQVKAVGEGGSFGGIKAVADRIDALLQGASGAVSDGCIWYCVREQPLAYAETDEGIQYRHLGGLYRIAATAWEPEAPEEPVEPEPEAPEEPVEPEPEAPEEPVEPEP